MVWLGPRTLEPVPAAAVVIAVALGCAPPRPAYRAPLPPPGGSLRTPPPPAPSSRESQEIARRPLPQESRIREQNLKTGEPPKKAPSVEPAAPPVATPGPSTPPLPDDSSLLAKITAATPPQRAASLRLTEEGRKLLEAGDAGRALARLERTIVIDSTNPYGYFFLAKAHYQLGRYHESLNFLDVAETRLSGEPFWLAEVHALRGENYRALGMNEKAAESYGQALRLNSGNRTAAEALPRLKGEAQSHSR
ncbi:MAG TPA: tetratricopeptide repeat protein [candidate division Zixibacteria bacterium]|nr:tetratricopeptide repeat protein [candidate division Zixibacteria bacterium]